METASCPDSTVAGSSNAPVLQADRTTKPALTDLGRPMVQIPERPSSEASLVSGETSKPMPSAPGRGMPGEMQRLGVSGSVLHSPCGSRGALNHLGLGKGADYYGNLLLDSVIGQSGQAAAEIKARCGHHGHSFGIYTIGLHTLQFSFQVEGTKKQCSFLRRGAKMWQGEAC